MYDDYKIMKQREFEKLKKEYDNMLNVDSLNYEIKIYNSDNNGKNNSDEHNLKKDQNLDTVSKKNN